MYVVWLQYIWKHHSNCLIIIPLFCYSGAQPFAPTSFRNAVGCLHRRWYYLLSFLNPHPMTFQLFPWGTGVYFLTLRVWAGLMTCFGQWNVAEVTLWDLWSFCSTPLGMLLWVHHVKKPGLPCGREPSCPTCQTRGRGHLRPGMSCWVTETAWMTLASPAHIAETQKHEQIISVYFKQLSFGWYVVQNRKLRQGFWLNVVLEHSLLFIITCSCEFTHWQKQSQLREEIAGEQVGTLGLYLLELFLPRNSMIIASSSFPVHLIFHLLSKYIYSRDHKISFLSFIGGKYQD